MFQDDETRPQRLVLKSRALVVESRRLLLSLLERRFQGHQQPGDARSIERLRKAIDVAERNCRDAAYARLIHRASACAERLTSSAPKLHPEEQFKTAVSVQAIEELVHRWRAAATNRA